MSTISVPLSKEQLARLDQLVASGVGENKAAVMRRALDKLAEDEAVRDVLEAMQELKEGKALSGDLRELARKMK